MELVRKTAGFSPKSFARGTRYSYCRSPLLMQAFEQMGERFIESAQLGDPKQSKFSPVHAFKGREACTHTTGPCHPTFQPAYASYQVGIARGKQGQNITYRG